MQLFHSILALSMIGVTTGADGRFFVGRLEVGAYTLRVAQPGFRTVSDDQVTVSGGVEADATAPAAQSIDVSWGG